MPRKNRRKASVELLSPRKQRSVDTSSPSPRRKRSDDSKPSRTKMRKAAKDTLHEKAQLKKHMVIRTESKSYEILSEIREGTFNYLYEVKEKGGKIFFLRTEPCTTNKDLELFKTLKYELLILKKVSKPPYSVLVHFPRFQDSGATGNFKFLVMQPLGETLYDITRKRLNSAFTMSTALRTAIQTLQAVAEFHTIGYLHRGLSPMSFFVGGGAKMRTIYMGEFGFPFSFRNHQTGLIKQARSKIPTIGVLRFMSRAAHEEKEHCRRDDLESWAYMSMEFFDLNILPWYKDQNSSDVLRKKQKTINGDYPSVFEMITLRFKHILRYISSLEFCSRPNYEHIQDVLLGIGKMKKIDFKVPYDWEVFSEMSDKLEVDPITNRTYGAQNAKSPGSNKGAYAEPAKEVSKEESAHSPSPTSVGSEISNEKTALPKATVIDTKRHKTQEIESKPKAREVKSKPKARETESEPIENDKSEYFFLEAGEKRVLPATLEPGQSDKKKGAQIDHSPKFELSD
jgi:tau tubulin kinase